MMNDFLNLFHFGTGRIAVAKEDVIEHPRRRQFPGA